MIDDAPFRPVYRRFFSHLGSFPAALLFFCLTIACPAHAQFPPQVPGNSVKLQSGPQVASDEVDTISLVRQKLQETKIQQQELRSALAAKNPPTYASFAELSDRQVNLLATRMALENWLDALKDTEKVHNADRDLENAIQSWSGFDMSEPYPIGLADQLAAELRSRQLEYQTEKARGSIEDSLIDGFRKELAKAGPRVRQAAEALERAKAEDQPRLRWNLESAEALENMAEAQLQGAIANTELNKLRISLAQRRINFLEEKLDQTSGKTVFSDEDLDNRLKKIALARNSLNKQLLEAEDLNDQAQQRLDEARISLDKAITAEKDEQAALRQTLELRYIEAGTTDQTVETLKLLLGANSLERILWKERFNFYEGTQNNQSLTATIKKLEVWQTRIGEYKEYYSSKVLLTRKQIQTQSETLQNWPEQLPGKSLEKAKLEAFQARMKGLEQLLSSTETIHFLSDRLQEETSAGYHGKPIFERFQTHLHSFLERILDVWNYEIFSVEDTIIADGKVISGRRAVTLKKLIYGLLLLTLGIWAVGRLAKFLRGRALKHLNVERNLVLLIEKTGYFLAVLCVVLVALSLVQIPIAAFAFLGGALAIGVGFGGQNLINNFMSSLILLIEKPIKVGDVVEVEGVLGRVTGIGGRCSTIRRYDGVELLVPNSHLLEKTVVNRTLCDNLVRYDLKVGVAYGSPTRDVFKLLEQVVSEHGQIIKDPKPVVLLEDFGDNALNFGVYYWVEVNDRNDVRVIASDLRHRIDRLFRDSEIIIAFPQRDVHLDSVDPLKIQLVAETSSNDADLGQ